MSRHMPQPAPPEWTPARASAGSAPPSGANLPYPPASPEPLRAGWWWPYMVFGGVTPFIGCLALIVVALSR